MLGKRNEGLWVQVLSYYYNELKGCSGLLRDVIIAISFLTNSPIEYPYNSQSAQKTTQLARTANLGQQ